MKVSLENVDKSIHKVSAKSLTNANKIKDLFTDLQKNSISLEKFQKQLSTLVSPDISINYDNGNMSIQVEVELIKVEKRYKKPQILALYGIEWIERERGMGMRPDGFSFHDSEQSAEDFVKKHNAKLPKEVPYEYSAPAGPAKLLEVSESLYNYVMKKGSIWLNLNNSNAYKTYDASHLKK